MTAPSDLRTIQRVLAMVAVLIATACGSGMLDEGFPTGVSGGGGASASTSATYLGVIADSLKRGHLSVTVSSISSVSGVLTFIGGPTVPVTGTVDTAAQQVSVTGGGYSLTGFTNNGTIQGSYTGPGGNGLFAAAADSLTGMIHTSYCGSYTSTNGNGWFSMVALSDGETGGIAVQTRGSASSTAFTGTIIGNTTFTAVTNQAVSISGSLSTDLQTITGTYSPMVGTTAGTGTFAATTGGC